MGFDAVMCASAWTNASDLTFSEVVANLKKQAVPTAAPKSEEAKAKEAKRKAARRAAVNDA